MMTQTTPEGRSDQAIERVTRSGLRLAVRPVAEADQEELGQLFAALSPDDLRFRFLSSIRSVTPAQIDALTHVDHRLNEGFVVTLAEGGPIVAHASLAGDSAGQTAEVAIALHKDHKGQGIGWTLLDHVARAARARGFRTLQSIENRENHQAIELEREMGFIARPLDGDPSLVVLEARLQD